MVPSDWQYASSDGLILLTGRLVSSTLEEGSQFELAPGGVYVQHPALITISTAPNGSQTLRSLNSNTPIFTLPVAPAPPTPADTPAPTSPKTIVTLHLPLLTPASLASLRSSPVWSSTFNLLLQGPNYPPPSFDPSQISDGTPTLGPTHAGASNSPTLQRVLLSPLLSPQRRAASQGSDISVPPLSIGIARGRAPSVSSSRPHETTGLQGLLPPAGPEGIAHIAGAETGNLAKRTAEEIMVLRRRHDAFVRRVRAEQDVLEARAGATNGAGARVMKGFGETLGPARAASKERSRERDGSVGRDRSSERSPLGRLDLGEVNQDRGRARKREDVGPEKDEEASKMLREEERAEEEARGRSRSRVRRGEEKKDKSKVVASSSSNNSTTAGPTSPGVSIPATSDPSDEVSLGPGVTATFIPHSHALVAIPESEELSLPPSVTGTRTPEPPSGAATPTLASDGEDEEEAEEEDTPFEMDEDIDLVDLDEDEEANEPLPDDFAAPSSPAPQAAISMSFRPASHRASVLASSYAALLSTSLARQAAKPLQTPMYSPPAAPILSNHSAFSPTQKQYLSASRTAPIYSPTLAQPLSSFVSTSPPDVKRPTGTSAREDAQTGLSYVGQPDPKVAREGERKIREVLAMDAPSHRAPLPRKRQSNVQDDDGEEEETFEEEDDFSAAKVVPSAFVVGSLPIQMGERPTRVLGSNILGESERQLQRKTSVPGRQERHFVPPLKASTKKVAPPAPSAGFAIPMEIGRPAVPAPSAGASSHGPSSSLAQSLRNPPPSFARKVEEEEREEEEEEEGGFVPPHVWAAHGRPDEELLSRSVSESY